MDFVHIELWRDFEAQEINVAAAEWIWPDRRDDATEPWVVLVGADGNILQRWDDVATEASLARAVEALVGM